VVRTINYPLMRLFISFMATMSIMQVAGCNSSQSKEQKKFEDALSRAMQSAKNDVGSSSFDIQSVTDRRVEKVCVQPSYMVQQDFSRLSGKKLTHYESIDDRWNVIWVFFEGAEPVRINVDRWKQMDLAASSDLCTSGSSIFFSRAKDSSEPKLFIKGK